MTATFTHHATRARTGRVRRVVGLMVLAAAASLIWPARFGGSSSLVVVDGHSMEPTYHDGDTLYVRTASRHQPGDIVVYKIASDQPGAGLLIVHRIIGSNAAHTYVTKGDNRTTPDDTHPSAADIIGHPIANLGPLPSRLLRSLPDLISLAVGAAVARALWPRRPKYAARDDGATDDDGTDDDQSGPVDLHGEEPVPAAAISRVT